jgi:epoxyqueuosine reductase
MDYHQAIRRWPNAGQPEKIRVALRPGPRLPQLIRKRLQQLAESAFSNKSAPSAFAPSSTARRYWKEAIAEQAGSAGSARTPSINRKAGSYFFLAKFVDLPLPVDEPHSSEHCGRCTMDIRLPVLAPMCWMRGAAFST